ncbi:MAG: ATP phosphoribosyltransferase [Bacteroidales bacterium]|nr:ATP phosphoribosyltransferase [Bacteroidales bacterium]
MIRIAIQSKGRLNEESLALLQSIGIEVDTPKRKLLSKSLTFPIEALYLRDDDIPQVVAGGTATLGIVGLNEVEERGADVDVVCRLGFGACRLSLAVPKGEAYDGPSWFNGRRIATSYPEILGKYLKKNNIDAKVEVITGSVEIAPAVGIADAIFDIVSSGSTLIANGLKEVETVFESEAVLIANKDRGAEEQAVIDDLLFRIESETVSRGKKYLLMNLPKSSLDEAIKILPAMRSPTVMPLANEDWCSLHSVIDAADLWTKVRQLKAIGAEGILVMDVDKIIL